MFLLSDTKKFNVFPFFEENNLIYNYHDKKNT
jgi:hypothetical protein